MVSQAAGERREGEGLLRAALQGFLLLFLLDIDDFIVDDDGQPLKKPKWRKKLPGYTDA